MSHARLRQIVRLEKLAEPYLEVVRQTEKEWRSVGVDAAGHAAYLSFLIRYGNPTIGEPLSCAWERSTDTIVWKEYCDKWVTLQREKYDDRVRDDDIKTRLHLESPFQRNGALMGGMHLRHGLIDQFPGANEKEKLKEVFASAPPWLIWFTFADYTAELLGLPLPDLSSVAVFTRSKADFDNLFGLPSGAFVPQPWPDGPEHEPLAHTDLNLLRPAPRWPVSQMTPRERKRAHHIYMKHHPIRCTDSWPPVLEAEVLALPFSEFLQWGRQQRDEADRLAVSGALPSSFTRSR